MKIYYPRVKADIEREVEAISIILVAYFLVFRIFLEGGDSPGTGPGTSCPPPRLRFDAQTLYILTLVVFSMDMQCVEGVLYLLKCKAKVLYISVMFRVSATTPWLESLVLPSVLEMFQEGI